MIAYIYYKDNSQIIQKIDNITSIDDSNNKIEGDSIIVFGDSQSYIILENDNINLNVGDIIDIAGLENAKDYFLKGKDFWYQEQIKKANEISNNQQLTINSLADTIIELSMNITTL